MSYRCASSALSGYAHPPMSRVQRPVLPAAAPAPAAAPPASAAAPPAAAPPSGASAAKAAAAARNGRGGSTAAPPLTRRPAVALRAAFAACSASSDTIIADMKKTFKKAASTARACCWRCRRGTCTSGAARASLEDRALLRPRGCLRLRAPAPPPRRDAHALCRHGAAFHSADERGVGRGRGRGAPEFRFRIVNELAYFTREYDPTNPAHRLAIGFTTSADLRRFEAEVYPCVVAAAGGGAAGAAPQPLRSAGSVGRVGARR